MAKQITITKDWADADQYSAHLTGSMASEDIIILGSSLDDVFAAVRKFFEIVDY